MPTHTKQAGITRVGAPLHRSAHNLFCRYLAEAFPAVALTAMGTGHRLQNRDRYNLGFLLLGLLFTATARCREIQHRLSKQLPALALGQHTEHVAALQPGSLPI